MVAMRQYQVAPNRSGEISAWTDGGYRYLTKAGQPSWKEKQNRKLKKRWFHVYVKLISDNKLILNDWTSLKKDAEDYMLQNKCWTLVHTWKENSWEKKYGFYFEALPDIVHLSRLTWR